MKCYIIPNNYGANGGTTLKNTIKNLKEIKGKEILKYVSQEDIDKKDYFVDIYNHDKFIISYSSNKKDSATLIKDVLEEEFNLQQCVSYELSCTNNS